MPSRLSLRQAFAHAQLEKATPPVGGTVASASEIRLEFSEGVEPKFTKVSLTGPGGAVPLGAAKTESGNQAVLIVPITKGAGGRRVQRALAGGVGRHAPYPGNLRIHGEAMTAARAALEAMVGSRKGRTMRHSLFALALAFAISAAPALAQEFKAGDIVIEKPWARATPKGAEVGGGYLGDPNNGATPDRLTGGSADFAAVEVHQMSSKNGVSEMRELEGGLAIPAHGSVGLSPGGYHLMFTHLTHPLMKGESVKATLNFVHAGPIEVEFSVTGIGAAGPAA